MDVYNFEKVPESRESPPGSIEAPNEESPTPTESNFLTNFKNVGNKLTLPLLNTLCTSSWLWLRGEYSVNIPSYQGEICQYHVQI